MPLLLEALAQLRKDGLKFGSLYLHQASKVVIDGIISAIPAEFDVKIPTNYFKYGNTVSSTIPILIAENGLTTSSGTVDIFCGFGVGLSCSIVGLMHK